MSRSRREETSMKLPDGGMKARPRVQKKTAARLLSYIFRRYSGTFVLVLLCILVSAGAGVAGSLFLQLLIDGYITPLLAAVLSGQGNPSFSGLLSAILGMGAIYLAGVAATYLYNRLMVVIAQGVLKEIRDDMFTHMQSLPIRYFDTHQSGDIMSRYTNDTDTLRQMIAQSLPQMFASVITIAAVFCAMVATSIYLTLVVLAVVAVMLLISRKIAGKSRQFFQRQQQSLGRTNGYIEEMIHGQKVVKVFCHEKESREGFDRLNEELRVNAAEANRFANILMPIMGNIGHLQYVLIAMIGGFLALSGVGGLTMGMIASFLQLSKSFSMPVSQVSQQLNSVIMALAGAERIFELMDEEPEADEGYVTLVNARMADGELTETEERTGLWAWKHPHQDGSVTYTPLKGDVRFDDVDFGYTGDKLVLHGITLFAEPGQKVAFVGATGAGKTTITNLINRFYDLADGKIRYDGININKIRKSDLRRSLGIVLQDTSLFTGTVMENIRYGRLDATDEEVYAAARRANADGFIRLLPQGYETVLSGDGSGLSQGQRQLLSIARAAVADPPVMILDEATSSIDTRTESIVQRGMDALMRGRTVFVIAHRLSTVRNADVIMVLDAGHIIERGTHEQLIAQKGRYYQLYTGAFELD
ncbi:MAG: ABC transporter ATP-binding protein [Clostridiales bacterium]|nr:ABC transporter ATP-binding protein [Clostridiales bacterium]